MSKPRTRRNANKAESFTTSFTDTGELDDRTVKYAGSLARQYIAAFEEEFDEKLEMIRVLCKSPIERTLAAGMLFLDVGHGPVIHAVITKELPPTTPEGSVSIIPQCPIDGYKADFLLLCDFANSILKIIVECDGHDFHERTKEQAKHDRSRDRHLTALGYTVFRFTGSEIHANPEKCVEELRAVIHRWATSVLDALFARKKQ
jgi:very-short-patch-repair endonuclease